MINTRTMLFYGVEVDSVSEEDYFNNEDNIFMLDSMTAKSKMIIGKEIYSFDEDSSYCLDWKELERIARITYLLLPVEEEMKLRTVASKYTESEFKLLLVKLIY